MALSTTFLYYVFMENMFFYTIQRKKEKENLICVFSTYTRFDVSVECIAVTQDGFPITKLSAKNRSRVVFY